MADRKTELIKAGPLRIAQAQMPVITDPIACRDYLEEAAAKAAGQKTQFLLLPEMFCGTMSGRTEIHGFVQP